MHRRVNRGYRMDITYHEENDYLIPNVIVGYDTTHPIGKYSRLRREYLREHRPVLYGVFVQNGILYDHLIETESAGQSRLEAIVPALAKSAGATGALKAADQMKLVGVKNACKAQVEEVIFQEIIFAIKDNTQIMSRQTVRKILKPDGFFYPPL